MDIKEIPHGHGLSFKRGIADGILSNQEKAISAPDTIPEGHDKSYRDGFLFGVALAKQIAEKVKK